MCGPPWSERTGPLVTLLTGPWATRFRSPRVRTLRSDADQFYLALGFRRTAGEPEASHDMNLNEDLNANRKAPRSV